MPVSAAGSSAEYIKYVVPFISDQTKQTQVCGLSNESLLKDGVVLIPLETACEIAGATIKAETDEAVIASRNYVSWCCNYNEHKKQYLLVDWHTGKGDYYAAAFVINPPSDHLEKVEKIIKMVFENPKSLKYREQFVEIT